MTQKRPATDAMVAHSHTNHPRPFKRQKTAEADEQASTLHALKSESIRSHPLGIRPLGNAYDAPLNIKSFAGCFNVWPDELLLAFFEYLEPNDVLHLGLTCKTLYAFSRAEELWKNLYIASRFTLRGCRWRGSWFASFNNLSPSQITRIRCDNLFSDVLHRPFYCAHVPLLPYASGIPSKNQIARLCDLSAEDFHASWADKPFILTEPVKSWPIYRDMSIDELVESHGQKLFRAEAVDWPFDTYASYLSSCKDEESPLYLFDCRFAEKMGLSIGGSAPESFIRPELTRNGQGNGCVGNGQSSPAYSPPPCFSPDLFTLLEDERPDHRWLIIGPARSGSTFHKDPNGTSAWNAVLKGRKYWLMFPPVENHSGHAQSLPGLHISPDGAEITAPVSIAEYLTAFHDEARRYPGAREAICEEGEVLHVPAGWYHMVVNLPSLEDGEEEPMANIALTQNFVCRRNLPDVLEFLRDKPEQVSGFKRKPSVDHDFDAYELFTARLKERHPNLLEEAMVELEKKTQQRNGGSNWEHISRKTDNGNGGNFSFEFSDDEDDLAKDGLG